MSAEKMTVDKICVDEMTSRWNNFGQNAADEMTVDKMPANEMTVDKMPVNEMPVDEMPWCQLRVN